MRSRNYENTFSRCVWNKLKTTMKKKTLSMLYFAILAMATLCLASCSKSVTDDDDDTAITAGQGNSNLSILTRAGEGEGSVAYPVVLYVFNSSNQCVAVKTLADETAELTIEGLKADTYNVFAIGGADNTRYSLPTQANATPTTLITLLEGKVHEDLMTGRNTVVIGDDEDNQLTLALQRKVAMVKQVEVKMVPADAEAVSLVITPLREAFQLNGDYSGEAGSFTQDLVKQSDNRTWKNATEQYMLPSVGNATITIKMTLDGNVRSYSYTCAEPLLANYKLNIDATYTGNTFNMTGTLTGTTWEGERTITFEFNEDNVTGSEETTQGGGDNNEGGNGNEGSGNTPSGETTEGSAPAVGTDYQGAYVLRSVDNGDNTVTVTLMSAEEATGLTFDRNDQASIIAAVNDAIVELSVGDFDWRLPTKEELQYAYENSTSINNELVDCSFAKMTLSYGVTSAKYFATDEGGTYIACTFSDQSEAIPNSATIVRAFTTLTFNK